MAVALLACVMSLVTAGRAHAWHHGTWPAPCHPVPMEDYSKVVGGVELQLIVTREENALRCHDDRALSQDRNARLSDLRDSLAPRTSPTLYSRLDELEAKSDVLADRLATANAHAEATHQKLDTLHADLQALTVAVREQTRAAAPGATDADPAYVRLASSEPLAGQLAQRQDDLLYAIGVGLGLLAAALPGYGLYRLVMPRA